MNFYKRFIGDYQRDTAHLSLAEHGAYTLMLDLYYGAENALPSDRKVLYRMMRADGRVERQAIDAVIDEFWIEGEGGYTNPKADRVLAEAADRSDKAKKSAETRWTNRQATNANASKTDANAKRTHRKRIKSRDASHSQSPDSRGGAAAPSRKADGRPPRPEESTHARNGADEEPKTRPEIEGAIARWEKMRDDLSEGRDPANLRATAELKIAELRKRLESATP